MFLVTLQEVIYGLYPDFDGPRRLALIDIEESEVGSVRRLDDLFYGVVVGGIVAALETGQVDGDQIGVAGHILGAPYFLAGVFAVGVFPNVGDVHGVGDDPRLDLFPEQPLEDILVLR